MNFFKYFQRANVAQTPENNIVQNNSIDSQEQVNNQVQPVVRKYGWIRDLPDHRDKKYVSKFRTDVPPKIIIENMPPVYDQGQLGSCTANAIAGAFEFDLIKEGHKDFIPSRLFIYYNERFIEHSVTTDSGASLRDGMKTINTDGVCDELIWPYNIHKFTIKPSEEAYNDASKNKSIEYYSIEPVVAEVKQAIADGFPVIFGFSVPQSFESMEMAQTGIMNMPHLLEPNIGGHAVLACGYDDNMEHNGLKGFILVRNSWGTTWGQKGYFWMPYAFFNNKHCDDCWVLKRV